MSGTDYSKQVSKRKWYIIALVILIIVVIITAIYTTYFRPTTQFSANIAPSTLVAPQGTQIQFTVVNNNSNIKSVTWYLGDGNIINGSSSISYAYNTPGKYLVYAVIYSTTGQSVSTYNNLYQITITPSVNRTVAQFISVPVIAFNTTVNPNAPIVNVNETVYLYGGFLEAPSGNNITILKYVWDFGNGQNKIIDANSSTLLPVENPIKTFYSKAGLFPVKLTIITENASSMKTYNFSVIYTLAVKSSSLAFAIFKYKGTIPNPGVITVAKVEPGGPYSLDPNIDYELVGFEIISNIFMTLVAYNGSSTDKFIPYAAAYLPTVENGGISNNYTVYNFTIRSGLKFSNGDPLTAYDVWYSIIRAMLFNGGSPGTGDWIITTQALLPNATPFVPLMQSPNDTATFNAIMHAVTYSNKTNTVAFHLGKPLPPVQFFQFLAFHLDAAILDAKYLQKIGAGITFTPKGFYEYQFQANLGNYSRDMQYNPIGSGPYKIGSYVPGQSITLVPNPYYQGIPGIPKVNNTVVIYWVKDPETALLMFQSGQADIVYGLPTNDFPVIKSLEAQGQASIYFFPTLTVDFWVFNLNIYSNATLFGSQYHIPQYYFMNLKVRKAFAYAFDYQNFIDNILGNKRYGGDFGFGYCGVIPKGMLYYVPPEQLQGCPTYNLTYAKQLLIESGMYNVSVNFPIIIFAGDTVHYLAAQKWAQDLHQIDPNIVMTPIYLELPTVVGYDVPNQNPMPIWEAFWIPDYPYATDNVNAMYLQGGFFPSGDGWDVQLLNKTGYVDQANMYAELNNLLLQAESTLNSTLAARLFKEAEQTAINLYMYVYTYQLNGYWIIKPYITPYKGDISYQEHPLFGGSGSSLFYWWNKG